MIDQKKLYNIAIVGGTGKEGKGLAYRWVQAGHEVVIGSRQHEKAQKAVDTVNDLLGQPAGNLRGMKNKAAVAECEIAVITVPYAAHRPTLEDLKD